MKKQTQNAYAKYLFYQNFGIQLFLLRKAPFKNFSTTKKIQEQPNKLKKFEIEWSA